jgi:hypothetical protein
MDSSVTADPSKATRDQGGKAQRGIALTTDPGSGVATDLAVARDKLKTELRELDDRLGAIVDVYEEKPKAIDAGGPGAASSAADVEAMITVVYRVMKTRVYAEDSPLRADIDMWVAFREQKDEFIDFYKSALRALETYQEVLRVHGLMKTDAGPRPGRGGLERVRRDKRIQVAERDGCIEAVSDFHAKFSAMLTVLSFAD